MTAIQKRCRVDSQGNLVIPVGIAEAGTEVDVTIQPLAATILDKHEWAAKFQRTAGSIQDNTFDRPEQADFSPRDSFS